jgi:hypothetical protein
MYYRNANFKQKQIIKFLIRKVCGSSIFYFANFNPYDFKYKTVGKFKKENHTVFPAINDTDRLCGLVVRVSGYRSRGPGSIRGATRFSEK